MKGGGDQVLLVTVGSLNQGDIKEESDILVSKINYSSLYELVQNKEPHVFNLFRSTLLQTNKVDHFKVAGWIPTNVDISLDQIPWNAAIFNGITENGTKAIYWFDPDRYPNDEMLCFESVPVPDV